METDLFIALHIYKCHVNVSSLYYVYIYRG